MHLDIHSAAEESLEPVMAKYPEIETRDLSFIPDWAAWKRSKPSVCWVECFGRTAGTGEKGGPEHFWWVFR